VSSDESLESEYWSSSRRRRSLAGVGLPTRRGLGLRLGLRLRLLLRARAARSRWRRAASSSSEELVENSSSSSSEAIWSWSRCVGLRLRERGLRERPWLSRRVLRGLLSRRILAMAFYE